MCTARCLNYYELLFMCVHVFVCALVCMQFVCVCGACVGAVYVLVWYMCWCGVCVGVVCVHVCVRSVCVCVRICV